MAKKKSYPTREAADLIGVKVGKLQRAVWDGRVTPPATRLGRSFLWTPHEIESASWALLRKSAGFTGSPQKPTILSGHLIDISYGLAHGPFAYAPEVMASAIGWLFENDDAQRALVEDYFKHLAINPDKPEDTEGRFIDYWNSKEKLPKIASFTSKRKSQLKTRLKEVLFAENFEAVIDKLAASGFHTGDNDRKWVAKVDFILKNDTNYVKLLETDTKKPTPEFDQWAIAARNRQRQMDNFGKVF